MNKYNGYIAVLVVFFVVFLGMRNPWLDDTPGPKRKGRAVITNSFSKSISVSLQTSCNDYDNATPLALPLTGYEWKTPVLSPLMMAIDHRSKTQYSLSIRSSRAPPSAIS